MDIRQYEQHLKDFGRKVLQGSERSLWVSHSRYAMERHPVMALHRPEPIELREVFKRSWVCVLSYVIQASDETPANCCLYLCQKRDYKLEDLGPKARNHIRRGLKEFEIRFMDHAEFVSKGAQAYCDTIKRNGYSGLTAQDFSSGYRIPQPWRKFVGAFKDGCLGGFLLITELDDYVSFENYSADQFRTMGVNNGLNYFALWHYLHEQRFRMVTYGLSSLQTVTRAEGLHQFKLSMGFEAFPVHRVLAVNPALRPFVNRTSWRVAKGVAKLSKNHPILRKAEGAIRMVLESDGQLLSPASTPKPAVLPASCAQKGDISTS
jgi:hypothetical protein